MDQSPSTCVGGQKTATVIFNSECPKVVDRFRRGTSFKIDINPLSAKKTPICWSWFAIFI